MRLWQWIRRNYQTTAMITVAAAVLVGAGRYEIRVDHVEAAQHQLEALDPAVVKATAERNSADIRDIRTRTFDELRQISIGLAETRRDISYIKASVDEIKQEQKEAREAVANNTH